MCNHFGTMSKNSRASFYGGLIVLFQTSPESANIFRLIHQINVAEDIKSLKNSVIGKNGVTEEDFNSFLAYGTGIYTNMGNYKDSKILCFPPLAVCSIVTMTLVPAAETKSMAPPIPFTIFPGIIQLAKSPNLDTCIAPSIVTSTWPPKIQHRGL